MAIAALLTHIEGLEEQRAFMLSPLLDKIGEILTEEGMHPADVTLKLDEAYREIERALDDKRKGLKRTSKTFDKAKQTVCQDVRNII